MNDLFCESSKDVTFFAVCIILHNLRDNFASLINSGHSAGQNIKNTYHKAKQRIMTEREQAMIICRQSLHIFCGVTVVLSIERNLTFFGVRQLFHLFGRELFLKIGSDIVRK